MGADLGSVISVQALLDGIREPLLVLDGSRRVTCANRAFSERFRVPAEELPERSIFELAEGAFDVSALRRTLEPVLPEEGRFRDARFSMDVPHLGRRTVRASACPIRSGDERSLRILVAFEDLTEVEVAARAARRYERELRRSNRELEEFAHAASHDLQEPLRKVRIFADRLVEAVGPMALNEAAHVSLERIHSAVERMQTRIDDLLQLARVSRMPRRLAPVDLQDVAAAVVGELTSQEEGRDARIQIGELPRIEADPVQVELLFQNLVQNALKYRKPGGEATIRIEAEEAPPPADDSRTWFRISVRDEGIGFEPRYAERMFGAFQRLHGRTEYDGSGVGLSICRRIAERHGGTIHAEGVPGEGARFDLLLPVTQDSHEEEVP